MRSQLVFQKLPEGHSNCKRYFLLKLGITRYFSPVDIDFAKIKIPYFREKIFVINSSCSYYYSFSYCIMSFENADLKLLRPSLVSKVYINVRVRSQKANQNNKMNCYSKHALCFC